MKKKSFRIYYKKTYDKWIFFRGYDFPHSYQEIAIEGSSFYSNYIQRVVDFVHRGEIDAAGKVLIVLASVLVVTDESKY